MKFLIRPLSEKFLQRVREHGLDDLDQPVHRLTAKGGEPCREVLRRARPGEEILLASYCPFDAPGPFREYGPVYVLAQASDEPVIRHDFPAKTGEPTDYFGSGLVIRAYNQAQEIADATHATPSSAAERIAHYLARSDMKYVDARFPTYGCFACRFERAAG
jgi:Protein of unknown function (DUF1203)